MVSNPIVFDTDEVALCPNGHGRMFMRHIDPRTFALPAGEEGVFSVFGIDMRYVLVTGQTVEPTPEARASCLVCRHTMIVADEREA